MSPVQLHICIQHIQISGRPVRYFIPLEFYLDAYNLTAQLALRTCYKEKIPLFL